MKRTAVSALLGLAIVAGGVALATYVRVAAPDTWLFEAFALAQVVILGAVGFGMFEDSAADLKRKIAGAREKRRSTLNAADHFPDF